MPARRSPRRTPCQRSGDWAEQRVGRLLQERGWWLLARQWRCRWGELDLVLMKPGRLLLVEVKARARAGPDGWGRAALGGGKRLRLERCWACWLALHPAFGSWPVELVYVLVPLPPSPRPIRWLRQEL